jgi:hypothetical protein
VSTAAPAIKLTHIQVARRETLRLLVRSKTFMTGAFIILFWILCAIFGYHIAPHDPLDQSFPQLHAMSGANFFGTDQLGRDVFSRVITGARDILLIVPAATLLGIAGGTIIGLVTGYFRAAADRHRRHGPGRAGPLDRNVDHRDRTGVHPDRLANGASRGARRTAARLRRGGAAER